jgi:hypothetical protein
MSIINLWRTGGLVLAIGFLTLFIGGGGRHGIGLVLKPMAEDLNWDRGCWAQSSLCSWLPPRARWSLSGG